MDWMKGVAEGFFPARSVVIMVGQSMCSKSVNIQGRDEKISVCEGARSCVCASQRVCIRQTRAAPQKERERECWLAICAAWRFAAPVMYVYGPSSLANYPCLSVGAAAPSHHSRQMSERGERRRRQLTFLDILGEALFSPLGGGGALEIHLQKVSHWVR